MLEVLDCKCMGTFCDMLYFSGHMSFSKFKRGKMPIAKVLSKTYCPK